MNILVVGGGGREHAIIKKLKESPRVSKLYALPGNGGIAADAECAEIVQRTSRRSWDFAKSHEVDFAVVPRTISGKGLRGSAARGGHPLLRAGRKSRPHRIQ